MTVALLLVGLLAAGCATGRPVQATDLPSLKGKWTGYWSESGVQSPMDLEIFDVTTTGASGIQTWYKTHSGDMTTSFLANYENGKLVHAWGGGAHVTFDRYNPETQELVGTTRGRRGIDGTVYLKKHAK